MAEQFGNNNRGYQSVGDQLDQQNTGYSNAGAGYGDQRPYAPRTFLGLALS
jgi:hypothetical protein